ncbi:hypothetical protein L6164_037334 [Bauhinia variegata]|uniref:Uncharacterized protein n=1 Tax=Bauhinia variegata TaxID=167791 RepID=A0ACB9KJP8_BAUVA|nr:hypothetical protein L6164_037334 [Bauhinia variegata]
MNTPEQIFSEFYEKWILRLEEIVLELLQTIRARNQMVIVDSKLQALLSKATSHMKQFYTTKWGIAKQDCLPFFTPTWLTPFENSYLWVTGFKPSTVVFPLIDSMTIPPLRGVASPPFLLTPEQVRQIEKLRIKTWMEEQRVEREIQRIHVCWSVADRRMAELAQLALQVKDQLHGDLRVAQINGQMEFEIKQIIVALENAMKHADCVRLVSLKELQDILNPMQYMEFLDSFLSQQLRLRQWGRTRLMGTVAGGAAGPVTANGTPYTR